MATRRLERVSREVHETVARLLQSAGRDPAMATIVVSRVVMTPDLGLARVYWRLLAQGAGLEAARQAGERALGRAAGWLRGEVGRKLGIRSTPVLEFHYDEGQDNALRVEELLKEIGAPARPVGRSDARAAGRVAGGARSRKADDGGD